MTELTRRSVIAGAAAGAAAAMSPVATSNPANAAAPAVGKQTAGWYRYKVGDYEITVVTDGLNKIAKLPDNFVVNVPKEEVDKALTAAFHAGRLHSTFRIRRSW